MPWCCNGMSRLDMLLGIGKDDISVYEVSQFSEYYETRNTNIIGSNSSTS